MLANYHSGSAQKLRHGIISGYADMVEERLEEGWSGYLMSFMFHDLRGPPQVVRKRMADEAIRVYRTALTRAVRDPKKQPTDRLPFWLLSPDFPVSKKTKKPLQDVTLNDGVHLGGIALLPPRNRLQMPLGDHFINAKHLYVGRGSPLRRVHAEPLDRTPRNATWYTLKALDRGQVGFDDLIVLPFSRDEIS